MESPLYSTTAVAAFLGVTPGRIRQVATELGLGRKPYRGQSAPWLFTAAEIEAMRTRPTGREPGDSPLVPSITVGHPASSG